MQKVDNFEKQRRWSTLSRWKDEEGKEKGEGSEDEEVGKRGGDGEVGGGEVVGVDGDSGAVERWRRQRNRDCGMNGKGGEREGKWRKWKRWRKRRMWRTRSS